MLNKNESNFLCWKEKNINFFIKLYRSIELLTIIRLRKLPVFCLVYFMNIQASNISNCGQEANIGKFLIKIQEGNRIEEQDKEIIYDLNSKARITQGGYAEFTIDNLEYNGVRISSIYSIDSRGFDDLKLNDEGRLEGRGKNGRNISENEMVITDMLFYANITINNKTIKTVMRIIPDDYSAHNNIDSDTYEMKPFLLWVYLHDNFKDNYTGKEYDYMARLYLPKFFENCKLFTLNNKINSIKIPNFKNAGYIYYIDSKSRKLKRITMKPEISFNQNSERKGISKSKTTFEEDKKGINKLKNLFCWKRKRSNIKK